jgi:hypothetical protein
VSDADPRWWTIRPASSVKPATYRCPLCNRQLHAGSDHLLISPEGDTDRRRHAHTECVLSARADGRLPMRDEWKAAQPRRSLLQRLLGRTRD